MTPSVRSVPESCKFTIADQETHPPAMRSPNPRGWYHSVVGVVETPDGLLACYRLSDNHTAVSTHVMVADSRNGGRTWTGHRSIAHLNAWEHHAVWVAPQISRLRDGRLLIIVDRGHRRPGDGWPMISRWQQADRGMANYLLWSADNGRSWSGPAKIDDVGGEPSYVVELADGALAFTRTESRVWQGMYDPPQPWNTGCYRSMMVFSDDGGRTWGRTAVVTDEPYQSDNEVAFVELEPGHIMAITRVGFGGGAYGQPSRVAHSHDGGRTWMRPVLSPYYGQRPIIGRLRSGRLLVTYRNRWGTPGSCAAVFDPDETLGFQPASWILEESRCVLGDGAMRVEGGNGREGAVEFSLYPAVHGGSRVDLEAELVLEPGERAGGVTISAGFRLRIHPDRLVVEDRAGEALGELTLDATLPHRYRLLREDGAISVRVDGAERLRRPLAGADTRLVRFGADRAGRSRWMRVAAVVHNPGDYSIDWSWDASRGYPDRFRRERIVRLDRGGEGSDSGYGGWTQTRDGSIVIVDYTNAHHLNSTWQGGPMPFARAYVVREEDLI